jgi:hypothetical protein
MMNVSKHESGVKANGGKNFIWIGYILHVISIQNLILTEAIVLLYDI